ncbi:MAG: NADPH-dependent F420 reductase [Chloroflexi bacterium]|nr:NADPH-dependent F420 reductase [Chloroflexota bacterium]
MQSKPVLAVIGGTGKEGKGLAYRWLKAGYPVIIGSRSLERAQQAAQELKARVGDAADVRGLTNPEAAAQAEIVVVSVPYAGHKAILESIRDAVQGKLVVDVTVPLQPPKVTRAYFPPAGSAALEAQEILGPEVAVVDAFQNIPHTAFWQDPPPTMDVLVAGKGKANRERVLQLVADAGFRGVDAGPLANTPVVEGLTSVLLYINKRYGTHAGIRIVGLEADEHA